MEIGRTLREARMRQEIDISDVEEETKIRAKFLRALENEEWQVIPEEIYVRKFLETYAVALGLDPRPLLELYVIRSGSPDPAMTFRSLNDREKDSHRFPRWAVGASIFVVLVVVALIATGTL